ncbi:MAG: DUF424 family protein [Candidatus Micrarchaeota archaeon]
MYAKVHQRTIMESGRPVTRKIVAVCDAALLGKVFRQGELVLDLQKYRSFYAGEKVTQGRLALLLADAPNVNLVGPKAIAAAALAMKINPARAKTIGGVPHLQVYRV